MTTASSISTTQGTCYLVLYHCVLTADVYVFLIFPLLTVEPTTTTIATNATQGIVCKHEYMDECKILLGVAKITRV